MGCPAIEVMKMEELMNQFKKLAPFITSNVKARVTAEMDDSQVMATIHEEIIGFFDKNKAATVEYLTFNEDQRRTFSAVMYELLKPLAEAFKGGVNPKYKEYVEKSGKTGARNFIVNA